MQLTHRKCGWLWQRSVEMCCQVVTLAHLVKRKQNLKLSSTWLIDSSKKQPRAWVNTVSLSQIIVPWNTEKKKRFKINLVIVSPQSVLYRYNWKRFFCNKYKIAILGTITIKLIWPNSFKGDFFFFYSDPSCQHE